MNLIRVLSRSALFLLLASSHIPGAVIETTNDATRLAQTLIGSGVTLVGTPQLISASPDQQGIFSGAYDAVGFSNGIVLSTGYVNEIFAPNPAPSESLGGTDGVADSNWGLGGESIDELSAINGLPTTDGNALIFQFSIAQDATIFLNFVFASEEYIDYVGSVYNDAFAFFLDGENITLVEGVPITIENVNPLSNSQYFINNVENSNGLPVAGRNIIFDGLTTVLQVQKELTAGVHEIKIMIADTADGAFDSAVFLQAGTFSTTPTPTEIPEPSTAVLLVLGALGLRVLDRRRKRAALS
jgi:hypothetical protein